VIVSGYVTLSSKVFRQLIFHYLQNVFAGRIWPAICDLENGLTGRMNSFAGRIWPADRSLETPDIEEGPLRIEVNDDEHSLFMALRLFLWR